jgi:hypothetical protein
MVLLDLVNYLLDLGVVVDKVLIGEDLLLVPEKKKSN